MGSPKGKKSFGPENEKVFHPCPWVFLTFPFIQVLGPNQPSFSNTPGTPFPIYLASLTQHHCCSHRAGHPWHPPGNRSSLWESEDTKKTCQPQRHTVGTCTYCTPVDICVRTAPNRFFPGASPHPLCNPKSQGLWVDTLQEAQLSA